MALQMINADKRLISCQSQSPARCQPDQHAADKPGAGGCGNRIDFFKLHRRRRQRFAAQSVHMLNMCARGNLRHNAAIGGVQVDLTEDNIGEDVAAADEHAVLHAPAHNRRRCFIAARLQSQYGYFCVQNIPKGQPVLYKAQ